MDATFTPLDGGCACGAVRYRVAVEPIIVHCCHCRSCQRETGSAFALNAVVESAQVVLLQGEPETVPTTGDSGHDQRIVRCPHCRVAVWSHYPGGGDAVRFVRVGTLDSPDALPPDVHIYTASKQTWLALPAGARSYEQFYDPATAWTQEMRRRYRAAKEAAKETVPA